jgi:hypothetical protein
MGVFVVDTGGAPRAMVGPVTRPYEAVTPIDARLDDARARALAPASRAAPWTASYLAKAPPAPSIAAQLFACDGETRVVAQGAGDLGAVTITLLDHHGDPLALPVTRDVGRAPVAFAFAMSPRIQRATYGVEGVHVQIHDLARAGTGGAGRWDLVKGSSVYASRDLDVLEGRFADPRHTPAFLAGPKPEGAVMPVPPPPAPPPPAPPPPAPPPP